MELLAGQNSTLAMRQALFMTGMFSLMDVMLKMQMESLLSQLSLAPEVCDAILNRTGPCALVLQLAVACEQNDEALVKELCVRLNITLDTVNHKQALSGAWARESAQGL